jgi:hypothetical protein
MPAIENRKSGWFSYTGGGDSRIDNVGMIKSKFILDVLTESLSSDDIAEDGIPYWKLARPQIEYLTDINYEYTGLGLFVTFSHAKEVLKYKSEGGSLGGIDIKSPDLEAHANTTIFFEGDIIRSLEIFSVAGGYPTRDLKNYSFLAMPVNIINNLPPKYNGNLLRYMKLLLKHWLR